MPQTMSFGALLTPFRIIEAKARMHASLFQPQQWCQNCSDFSFSVSIIIQLWNLTFL